MTVPIRLLCLLALLFASCTTSVKLTNPDGSSMSGSLLNGSISYSSGAACNPAQPAPAVAPPAVPSPMSPVAMQVKKVCDSDTGANCKMMAVPMAQATPTCYTQVATVRGTDITTYFGWALGLAGIVAASVLVGT